MGREGFKAIEWINAHLGSNVLSEENIENVLYFSLMWNVFEGRYCNRNASINAIDELIEGIQSLDKLDTSLFSEYLLYFKSRYVENNNVNYRFKYLILDNHGRGRDYTDFVKNVLLGEVSDSKSVVLALMIIVYRYRNNLFHGEKVVETLSDQNENFGVANEILATILGLLRS